MRRRRLRAAVALVVLAAAPGGVLPASAQTDLRVMVKARTEKRFVMAPGEWELGAMVTNAGTIGEVQDDQRAQFTVSARD